MNHSAIKYTSIIGLNQQHEYITELFIMHQKLIMHGKMNHAIELLEKLSLYVRNHIKTEDNFLIPLYEKYISPVPVGGAVDFFRIEHEKINQFMFDILKASAQWTGKFKIKQIELVRLFDKYYNFKHLLDHHHTRENTYLFHLLDKVLEAKIKKEVLIHFMFADP